jgi:hypothetical protein
MRPRDVCVCKGFRMAGAMTVEPRARAGVRKPPREETTGGVCGWRGVGSSFLYSLRTKQIVETHMLNAFLRANIRDFLTLLAVLI